MSRIITLASGQYGDIPLEELAPIVKKMGYDGIELATHAHFDVQRALHEDGYVEYIHKILSDNNLLCQAISAHLTGQCVCDVWDERLDNFAPSKLKGKPKEIKEWAIEEMKDTARSAKKFGVSIVNGFTGSPIWSRWYSYPQTSKEMIEKGFNEVYDAWTPILDIFDEENVRFALEIHPTEIAFDWYTTKRVLDLFNNRKAFGINFDPSHLLWQGVDEVTFVRDFASKIYHVHMKDVKMFKNERAGILGSFLDFGDTNRAWNFVSVGHGDVDFDGIIRELNVANYDGPLSIEWEDSGMDRFFGAKESLEYVRKINYPKSEIAFDSALAKE
ncbi:MAG: sugar phosphate isomerase/epimerase [Spirochaetaceae bacterium]|nr:sugar phosphate isomerase/epimerase [Spirochaetaceae bacterium]